MKLVVGKRTRVHRNLKKGCWSVKQGSGKTQHVDCIYLKDPVFRVQPGERARALRTGHRNVHAYVSGVLLAVGEEAQGYEPILSFGTREVFKVTYHFEAGFFYKVPLDCEGPVPFFTTAQGAFFSHRGELLVTL